MRLVPEAWQSRLASDRPSASCSVETGGFFFCGTLHTVQIPPQSHPELPILVIATVGRRTGATLRVIERMVPPIEISKLDEAHERCPPEAVPAR